MIEIDELVDPLLARELRDLRQLNVLEQPWARVCLHEMAHVQVAFAFGVSDYAKVRINGGLKRGGSGSTWIENGNFVGAVAVLMAGAIIEELVWGRADEHCIANDYEKLAQYVACLGWAEDDERVTVISRMTTRVIAFELGQIIRAAKQLTEPGNFTV